MIDYTEVFKEISAIRKALREPIKHMPKYDRYLVGDNIQKQLLNIKVTVSLAYNYPDRFCYPDNALIEVKLVIHPDKLYMQECNKGITFIGGVIRPHRIYCGNRAVGKLYNRISTRFPVFNQQDLQDFMSSMNSYLGLMRHYKTYKIRREVLKNHIKSWLPYIIIGKNYLKVNITQ